MNTTQSPPPAEGGIRLIEIEGVSTPTSSVLLTPEVGLTPGVGRGVPTVFVHGILDNVWRWISAEGAQQRELPLPEPRNRLPLFDLDVAANADRMVPPFLSAKGFLERFEEEGLPALAYSYQDVWNPVARMSDAVEKLYRVTEWTAGHFGTDRVNLVGHSRGGLVCRHALLDDYDAARARVLRERVDCLVTLCTPHRGSSLAQAATPFTRAIDVAQKLPYFDRLAPGLVGAFAELLRNLAQLSPDSREVDQAATERLPPTRARYFAIAGDLATYVRCELPGVQLRLPPAFGIPEFTDGQGDMAVALPSALDIPDPNPLRTRILPVNHLTATFDPRVQETVIDWVRAH